MEKTKTFGQKLGERLRDRRKMQRLSRAELGRLAGVSTTTLKMWEKGTRWPEWNNLQAVAEVLEWSLDDVFKAGPDEADDLVMDIQKALQTFITLSKKGRAVIIDLIETLQRNEAAEASDKKKSS